MAFKKTEDLVVATRKYQDRTTGKEKNNYENVGSIMEDETGAKMILLKRTFNPAGVPNPDNRDTVIINRFPVKDAASVAAVPTTAGPAPAAAFDDDIPF